MCAAPEREKSFTEKHVAVTRSVCLRRQTCGARAQAGTNPSEIKVPYDIPTMKEKLFIWLSTTVDHLNQDWSGVEHCWKETDLLRAWYAYTSNVLHRCM